MSQTPEDRIRRHYKSLKRAVYRNGEPPFLWMTLASKWQRPVREIKRIVNYKQEKN